MPRFFFDVHNAGAAVWDDEGAECDGRQAIETRACQLVEEHADQHDGGPAPVLVSVLDEGQSVVLVAVRDGDHTKASWSFPNAD